jgi:signal transduction histidine kinase
MAVLTSPRRARPRFGPQAGLVAATRGVAFTGLMLAGLGLLIVMVGAVFFTALGAAALIAGNRGPQDSHMLLALVVLGAGLGLARFAVPYTLLGVRGLARLTRQLAGDWCGVPIPERYTPRPDETLTFTGRLRWLATDPATWRDLWWTVASPVTCILAALPAVIIATGLIEFIGPELTREIPPPAFPGNSAGTLIVLGLAIASAGVLAAPALLRGYGLLARSMLTPDGEAELASRVRQLTQTRTEALDTGAAEIRRIERDLHDGAQARLVAMGMTLDAAGQVIDTNPEAARALVLEARDASVKALAELRALIRGIHPPVLADRGLADAIRALALDTPARIHLASDLNGRPPAPVESAAYFAVSELLANVSKHAEARQTWIDIRHADEMLRIGVTDNGHGGAVPKDPSRGSGLRGIERRLAAFDGVLAISSPPGGPTAVTMEIPCALSSPKTSSC